MFSDFRTDPVAGQNGEVQEHPEISLTRKCCEPEREQLQRFVVFNTTTATKQPAAALILLCF